MNGLGSACMGLAPNAVQIFKSFHAVTGCGAFHLKAPTGGSAKGIPLNTSIVFSIYPATFPDLVCTIGV